MSINERISAPLLEIRDLGIDFHTPEGVHRAVSNLNLSLQPGEVMGLVGESGSGKSITAKSIMRMLPGNAELTPESRIRLHDGERPVDVMGLHGRDLRLVRGGQVSMIFQEPMASFAPAIRIGDQIVETLQLHTGVDYASARRQGIELFERVGIREPERRFDQYVFELSGGMRQRAMIAMALSTRPRLLIADEPTTALDVTVQAQVLELMLELREQFGMAMLFITHDLGVISRIADNLTVMKRGEVVEAGSCDRVLFAPQHEYTRRLLDALPHLEALPPSPAHRPEPLVSIRDLSITYPASGAGQLPFKAVPQMNLELPAGQIIGLVGESGSGKTSLGKALLGAAPVSAGEVHYHLETPIRLGAGRKIKRKELARVAQLVFQDPYSSLNPRMTVRDIIAEPLQALGLCRNREEIDQRVIEVAKRCHIEVSHLRRFPHAFSGGQRQRISIARALVVNPRFLVADEAVAALDVSIQAEILGLLKSLRDEMGLTILFISHDLSVVANLCDHVCVMQHGRLVEEGSVQQIFLQPQQPYTRALIGAIPTLRRPGQMNSVVSNEAGAHA
ncbi:dipeptide ABC transporter ATP-binding protein [Marinobacterium sediminicola]|uniref:ABC-type dipeptide transporter n=1 Tax=Marinobacterium sediminicola TaxID=518898 RepID=A0ABY1RYK0_9GAMM|nr:dipeptide ABC transporter ATP-binding protein [Marinobacterium sediminicola]ULG68082.1 dipeptide ABC transporter ATP-binding protein [Marinobacterium sediminicola]SMR73406.1 peptide/nickel transport system ATP-binding protein [Marinobacterium sediminicola]